MMNILFKHIAKFRWKNIFNFWNEGSSWPLGNMPMDTYVHNYARTYIATSVYVYIVPSFSCSTEFLHRQLILQWQNDTMTCCTLFLLALYLRVRLSWEETCEALILMGYYKCTSGNITLTHLIAKMLAKS